MDTLLSIIIPVYNSRDHIEKCLNSVLAISIPKEIIVIDDGSTDDSIRIIGNYKNKEIRIYKQANQGVSAARNVGLAKSQGQIIAFIDSDDVILKEAFETFYYQFVNSSAEIGVGATKIDFLNQQESAYRISPSKLHGLILDGQDSFVTLLKEDAFVPLVFNYLFKKTFLEEVGLQFHHRMSEDDLWTTCALCLSKKVLFTDQVHYNYRKQPHSITMMNHDSLFKADNLLAVSDDLLSFTKNQGFKKETLVWIYCKILYIDSAAIEIYQKNKIKKRITNVMDITSMTQFILMQDDIKAKRIALTYYNRIIRYFNSN
jgi:glycosyltransferase involved in cell wall biosynthesis